MSPAPEPTSVLYNRSPSPPTSSSLASSSAPEPPPISADDWEAVLSGDMAAARPQSSQDSSCFFRWIMGDADTQIDYAAAFGDDDGPFLLAPPPLCHDHPAVIEHFLHPLVAEEDLEPRAVVDELLEAARRADSGDSTGAREILTRLNHRLPSLAPAPGHAHPPLLRAAALLRDALLRRLLPPTTSAVSSSPSPKMMAGVALNKLAAHKALAEASPSVQFASFTCTQAILDALPGAARRVHVFDLGLGFGDRWPPLMQELALLQSPAPAIKLTALLLSPPDHELEVELRLARDSLTRFAADLGIRFEFAAVVFDPSSSDSMGSVAAAPGEAVAVHLPLGLGSPPTPAATLRVVRQLRPAVVVCVDDHGGCDNLNAMAALLESLDAAGAPADAVATIEHYILRPRVERLLLAGGHTPWQSMLASAGFTPVQLSAAAEAQAECLVSRTPTPGFNVVKRQAALALRWYQSELLTVSAWRC
ncbi:unnamed protein product [Urochloa humidicola]